MEELKQSFVECGYTGPCENLNILKWAIRAGASSHFFNELVYWLELQLNLLTITQNVRDNITQLLCMLRHSVLMIPSYGSDAAINPKEFRLQTLKVLIKQLQLRKLPVCALNVGENMFTGKFEDTSSIQLMGTVTLSSNQRLVRF